MKIIAFYLPQFHTFPENDRWWGKGFTEWTSVKNAKQLYKSHYQPRIPLDNKYYDLTDLKNLEWQAKIAKEYGVYGFCHYHYWFSGKKLMETPTEMMLRNKSVDIPFCLCWANHDWSRAWANKSKELLLKQTYGGKEEWKLHFEYLLEFFKDDRYIKVNGKPLMIIYLPHHIPDCDNMIQYWQQLAKENGFKEGLSMTYQDSSFDREVNEYRQHFEYGIEYQPQRVIRKELYTPINFVRHALNKVADKVPVLRFKFTSMTLNYDALWKRILNTKPMDHKMIPGAFVDWDNTPRHSNRGSLCDKVTPEKFEKYLSMQIKHCKNTYKKDMIFMFAWNEWGEGGYLEPDAKYEYEMLTAIKRALKANE